MPTIKNILVATDLSENANVAFDFARQLGGQTGATVHLLHVTCETPYLGSPLSPGLALVGEYRRQVEAELADHVAKLRAHGFEGPAHVVQGHPHQQIVREATRLGADLIVMGTHGRGGVEHFLLGSVAERVVRTSHVPVLVVPPPAAKSTG